MASKLDVKQMWITLGVIFALSFTALFLILRDDAESNTPEPDAGSPVQSADLKGHTPEESDPDEETVQEPGQKTQEPGTTESVNVTITPVAYTGFGHSSSNPLQLDQDTSTTCTTNPAVACTLVFTNVSTQEKIDFEAKTTDSGGVARWEWKGSDIGSGTWEIVATAGDKSSAAEKIFIQ